jgi:hypothetical protein
MTISSIFLLNGGVIINGGKDIFDQNDNSLIKNKIASLL